MLASKDQADKDMHNSSSSFEFESDKKGGAGRFRGDSSDDGLHEEEIVELIEGYREKWTKEDEATYATRFDFDAAQA